MGTRPGRATVAAVAGALLLAACAGSTTTTARPSPTSTGTTTPSPTATPTPPATRSPAPSDVPSAAVDMAGQVPGMLGPEGYDGRPAAGAHRLLAVTGLRDDRIDGLLADTDGDVSRAWSRPTDGGEVVAEVSVLLFPDATAAASLLDTVRAEVDGVTEGPVDGSLQVDATATARHRLVLVASGPQVAIVSVHTDGPALEDAAIGELLDQLGL